MRARHGLAQTLWAKGRRDEAVEHYWDMLRLNPNDNQGIRYLLLDGLLELGSDSDAARLLRQYKRDGTAAWVFSEALLSFRRTGDRAASHAALHRAVKVNAHVPAYLCGRKKLPRHLPDFIGIGDEDEAVAYVHGAKAAWAAAPGATAWLDAATADLPVPAAPSPSPE